MWKFLFVLFTFPFLFNVSVSNAKPIKVVGHGMEPNISDNEIVSLDKKGKLDRFKIVVIKIDDNTMVKRIIGLPGETIEYRNNKLFINEKKIIDDYNNESTKDFGPIKLSSNEYFVMGDNREVSLDSRSFGAIKKENIIGTVKKR